MTYSLDNCVVAELRGYGDIKTFLSYGPFDGTLFRLLDALGVRRGRSYGYTSVHSKSKATDGVYSSLKRDMLIFDPPMPINPSDVFYSENSKTTLDEDPYATILELITKCFHGGKIGVSEWKSVRKELMDGAELWALFKHQALDAHYDPKLNNRQTLIVKVRDMNRAFDDCIVYERDRARDEGDDVVKLIYVKQAIEDGFDKANQTICVAAHMAHQTLKGTPLAELNCELNQDKILKERFETKIGQDSISWITQLSTTPIGNVYFPQTTYDAKRMVAIGHLLNTNWILANSEHDVLDNDDEFNLLFVPQIICP